MINSNVKKTVPVTVGIPAYNSANSIKDTIDSILAQTVRPAFILVSDNGSSDDTCEIVETYKQYGVHLVQNKLRKTADLLNPLSSTELAISNFNSIINNCTTPYLALYHSDDIYDPTIIEQQYHVLSNSPNYSAVFAKNRILNKSRMALNNFSTRNLLLNNHLANSICLNYKELLNMTMLFGNIIEAPTAMINLKIIKDTRFTFRFEQATDLDFWLEISKIGPVKIINSILYSRRISIHQDSYNGKLAYFEKNLPYYNLMQYHLNVKTESLTFPDSLNKLFQSNLIADSILLSINQIAFNIEYNTKPCFKYHKIAFIRLFFLFPKSFILIITYLIVNNLVPIKWAPFFYKKLIKSAPHIFSR